MGEERVRVPKTRPARGDLCLTSDVGKKKQDPLGGTYVSPVTWAKKKNKTH